MEEEAKHKAEEWKGRAKEAAGDLTDDEELKREGQADEFSAKAKKKVDQAKDKVEEVIDKVKDKFKDG